MLQLESCYDFDAFFRDVKHDRTDKGIQDWHVFEFSRDSCKPGKVLLRTKREMDSTEWVPWRQGTATEGRFWPNDSGADGWRPAAHQACLLYIRRY